MKRGFGFAFVDKHASRTPIRMSTGNKLTLFMLFVVVCHNKVTYVPGKLKEKLVTITGRNRLIESPLQNGKCYSEKATGKKCSFGCDKTTINEKSRAGSLNRLRAFTQKRRGPAQSYSGLPRANDRNWQVHASRDVEQAIICRKNLEFAIVMEYV